MSVKIKAKRKRPELWGVWRGIKKRCYNENHQAYHNYGGRGIKVCDRWLNDYKQFESDMSPRPNGYEIDRIDNDGDYEPGNCRWVTRQKNSANRRDNVNLTANGKTQSQRAWADELNVASTTISRRIKKGQDFQWVYNHLRYNKKQPVLLTANGKTKNQDEWCKELGISNATSIYWLEKGKDFQWIYDRFSKKTPHRSKPYELIIDGVAKNQSEWSKELGVSQSAISYRLSKGESFQEIYNRFSSKEIANA